MSCSHYKSDHCITESPIDLSRSLTQQQIFMERLAGVNKLDKQQHRCGFIEGFFLLLERWCSDRLLQSWIQCLSAQLTEFSGLQKSEAQLLKRTVFWMSLRQAVALKTGMGDDAVTIWKGMLYIVSKTSVHSQMGKSVSWPEGPEVFGVKLKNLQHLIYSVLFL